MTHVLSKILEWLAGLIDQHGHRESPAFTEEFEVYCDGDAARCLYVESDEQEPLWEQRLT